MKKQLLLSVFLLMFLLPSTVSAQGENNIWTFGDSIGINFNNTPPTYFKTKMFVMEGSAAVSDASGALLFYTSGGAVRDRNGDLMPNGIGLLGNGPPAGPFINAGSSASGVAVVKSPSNPNQYYQIVTDAIEDQLYKAYYSVIDMTLNGGMGDVVPGQKNILLATDIDEGVITTKAAGCNAYWAMLRSRQGNQYLAFKIDVNGLNPTPVVSGGAVIGPPNYAMMHFNNAGNRLAGGYDTLEIADFNQATGVLSSFVAIPTAGAGGYLAFSPDDSKLYISSNSGLFQFDLNLMPNAAAVQTSRYTLTTNTTFGLRLAPDHKIYGVVSTGPLFAISNPNGAGAACGYSNQPAVALPPPIFMLELGATIVINPPFDTLPPATHYDTVCFQQSITLNGAPGALSYRWDNGTAQPLLSVNQDGTYWVKSFQTCVLSTDTFHVRMVNFDVDLGNDTSICKDATLVLNAFVPDAAYRWQDGSTDAVLAVSAKGTYSVSVTKEGCVMKDTIRTAVLEPYIALEEGDTLICNNRPFELHADAFPESTYTWNTGATSATLPVAVAGLYTVEARNICGTFMDSVRINTMTCLCDAFVPNAFTPNGDGANDVFNARLACPGMTEFVMQIYNRYGQRLFDSNDADRGWDGTQNGTSVDVGTYFYYVQYKTAEGEVIKKKGDVIVVR